jgi:hypothetical protein
MSLSAVSGSPQSGLRSNTACTHVCSQPLLIRHVRHDPRICAYGSPSHEWRRLDESRTRAYTVSPMLQRSGQSAHMPPPSSQARVVLIFTSYTLSLFLHLHVLPPPSALLPHPPPHTLRLTPSPSCLFPLCAAFLVPNGAVAMTSAVVVPEVSLPQLRGMFDALPDEEKKAPMGKALNYILSGAASLVQAGTGVLSSLNFRKAVDKTATLRELLSSCKEFTKEVVEEATKAAIDNEEARARVWKVVTAQRWEEDGTLTLTTQCVPSSAAAGAEPVDAAKALQETKELRLAKAEELTDAILNEVRASHREIAERRIRTSLATSAIIVLIQIIKLYCVFKAIDNASNAHNDRTAVEQIRKQLNVLSEQSTELERLMRAGEGRACDLLLRKMQRLYTNVKSNVSKLRIIIKGHIERLDVHRDATFFDGITNATMTASSSYEAYTLWPYLTGPYAAIALLVPAVFASLTAASVNAYMLTTEMLQKLRQDWQGLERLSHQLDTINDEIEAAEEWLASHGQ